MNYLSTKNEIKLNTSFIKKKKLKNIQINDNVIFISGKYKGEKGIVISKTVEIYIKIEIKNIKYDKLIIWTTTDKIKLISKIRNEKINQILSDL
jgi:hypothetical protein